MSRNLLLATCIFLLVACNREEASQKTTDPQVCLSAVETLLIHNARIRTLDWRSTTATAMLFDNRGNIKHLGDA